MTQIPQVYNKITCSEYPKYKNFLTLIQDLQNDDGTFIKFYSGNNLEQVLSFKDYSSKVCALANHLKDFHKVGPGDFVIAAFQNSPAQLIAFGAVICLGATIIPVELNPKLSHIKIINQDCKVVGVLSEHALVLPEELTEVFHINFESEGDRLFLNATADFSNFSPNMNDAIATVFYTSGTTGRSKGVPISQIQWLANSFALQNVNGMKRHHIHMCVLPLHHVNAFGFSYLASLASRSTLVLCRSFHPLSFWSVIDKEQVNVCSLVPHFIQSLISLKRNKDKREKPAHVRYFVSAAAALPKTLAETFINEFNIRILQGYGMSEATNFNLLCSPENSPEEYKNLMFKFETPSAGTPLWGTTVEIMGKDGKLLPDGEIGQIVMRGWSLMTSYVNGEKATKATLIDGWLNTGDLAKKRIINGKPYFFILGRTKEVIKRRGETISILEIEEMIRKDFGFLDFAIVGFKNKFVSEEIGIVLETAPHKENDEDLLEKLRQTLHETFCPRVLIHVEKIPKTDTGKIKRLELAKLFKSFEERRFR